MTRGSRVGEQFKFKRAGVYRVGRSDTCQVHLPCDPWSMDVSRQHCLVAVAPPNVRIRDLGSRNGTFVNDVKIGQRDPGRPTADIDPAGAWHNLENGDQIRMGQTVFRVTITDAANDDSENSGVQPVSTMGNALHEQGCVTAARELEAQT
jgi:pSer/pThr/pTyr-binding forkhead associated (FHA) protein